MTTSVRVELNDAGIQQLQRSVEAKIDGVLADVRRRLAGHPLETVRADLGARLAAVGVTLSEEAVTPLAVGISALPRG